MRDIGRKKIIYVVQACLKDGKDKFLIYPYGKMGALVKKVLNEEFGIQEIAVADNKLFSSDKSIISLDNCAEMYKDCVMLLASDNKKIWNEIREEAYDKFYGEIVDIANISLSQFTFSEEKLKIETCSQEQIIRIFEKTAMVWGRLGNEEPYWSVLTSDEYKTKNVDADKIKKFYESGEKEAERIGNILIRNDVVDSLDALKSLDIIEIGCGCGRVTKSLARYFQKVTAVDISKGNLDIARESVCEKNVEFQLIKEVDDYRRISNTDVIYSYLVLQHNCPPVIEYMIDSMFRLLRDNGVAIFQVPTYKEGYTFEYERYIKEKAGKSMEMHVFPQKAIFELAYKNHCIPMEVFPEDVTENEDNSTLFVIKKLNKN